MSLPLDLPARLAQVREAIAVAARAADRSPDSVRLVAVSKTQPTSAIRAAYAVGQRDFGESYVQELTQKAAELPDLADLRWHFIGHLQRNKAKVAARIATAVHTVDSVRLAAELGKRAAEEHASPARSVGPRLTVLVEVNVGGEAQKSGCSPDELGAVLGAIGKESALRLVGLMTVPPHTEDPSAARPFFERLAALRDAHGGAARLPELSMGMTHDLPHAIAAGATLVRVGTAIFGERP